MSFQGSLMMHQLHVTPLLLNKGSHSKSQFKRESLSFDNLKTSCSEIYSDVHKAPFSHRRSNPNILDILPPPPIYAPPSLPRNTIYHPPSYGDGNCLHPPMNQSTSAPQSHSAFKSRHIRIYDGCANNRALKNITIDNEKCPVHLNHCNKIQARDIDQVLEQELTSFHETLTNFDEN